MAWRLFRWGSRGEWYETDFPGIFTMAHIFIQDAVQVVFQGSGLYAQELINRIGVQVPGGGPASYADCAAIAGACKSWWENTYKNFVVPTTTISQIVATSRASAPAPQAQVTSGVSGSRSGAQTADQNTLCLKLGTNSTGRRHRGRFYPWPASTSDFASPDVYTTAYAAALIIAMGDLGNRLAAAGYIWGVISDADAKIYPIVRVVATDLIVDSQNRRTTQHGR
jgi:hypothetical protein